MTCPVKEGNWFEGEAGQRGDSQRNGDWSLGKLAGGGQNGDFRDQVAFFSLVDFENSRGGAFH